MALTPRGRKDRGGLHQELRVVSPSADQFRDFCLGFMCAICPHNSFGEEFRLRSHTRFIMFTKKCAKVRQKGLIIFLDFLMLEENRNLKRGNFFSVILS